MLTQRQRDVFDFIVNYIAANGVSPTVAEIAIGAGGIVHAGANNFVKVLIKKGYLKTTKNMHRSICVVPEELRILSNKTAPKTKWELTPDTAREIFEYRNGELFWKVSRGNVQEGEKAGVINSRGYLQVMLQKKNYLGHRIIFLIHHGYMPAEIDHIDGNTRNNRIENLREATHEQNIANIGLRKTNTSGAKNVSYRESEKKWEVAVTFKGERFYGGRFSDFTSAQEAAVRLRDKVHKEFANHGI